MRNYGLRGVLTATNAWLWQACTCACMPCPGIGRWGYCGEDLEACAQGLRTGGCPKRCGGAARGASVALRRAEQRC